MLNSSFCSALSLKNNTHSSGFLSGSALLRTKFFFIYKYHQILRANYVKNTYFFLGSYLFNISFKALLYFKHLLIRYIKHIIHNISNISKKIVLNCRGDLL